MDASISIVQELIDEDGKMFQEKHTFENCDSAYTYVVVNGEPVLKLAGNQDVCLRDGLELLEYESDVVEG